jgi:hypothetical protein
MEKEKDWVDQLGDVNREDGNRKGHGSDPNPSLIDELF